MKKVVLMLCLFTFMLGVAIESSAAYIDFEVLAHGDDLIVDHGAAYEEQGFLLTNTATEESSGFSPSLATLGTQVYGYTGSTMLFNDNWEGKTVLTQVGGNAFTLKSISLAELYPEVTSFDVTFTGLLSNGNTVSDTFTLDGNLGAQSYTFSPGFTELVSVSWSQAPDFHQFDNIEVSPVPVPGAFWLLGSLIVASGWRSKFKKG